MAVGTVKFFNTAKGYGFISPEGGEAKMCLFMLLRWKQQECAR